MRETIIVSPTIKYLLSGKESKHKESGWKNSARIYTETSSLQAKTMPDSIGKQLMLIRRKRQTNVVLTLRAFTLSFAV